MTKSLLEHIQSKIGMAITEAVIKKKKKKKKKVVRKPYHVFHNEHGHEIHVHLTQDEFLGKKYNYAHFHNHTLGDTHVGTMGWGAHRKPPSKKELENSNTAPSEYHGRANGK